MEEEYAALVAN
jgi:hypothetical protein